MKHPSSFAFIISFILFISFIVSEGRNITPLDYTEGKNQTGQLYTIRNSNSMGRTTNCSEKDCFESYGLMEISYFETKTEVAGAFYRADRILTGASALFNAWNVFVTRSACSGARVHMSFENNVIEFGWRVLPREYPDGRARLFTFMEDGRGQRCYNEECASFHFTSNRYSFSEPFPIISILHGPQFPVNLSTYKDPSGDKWWASIYDEQIGYWPINAFNEFFAATLVKWEGFVTYKRRRGEPHTNTGMGSGDYPISGYGRTAFIVDMLVKSRHGEFQPPVSILTEETTPGCYGVMPTPTLEGRGPGILYGGPGGPSCDMQNGTSDWLVDYRYAGS